jgi:hypothetical protein
MILKIIFVILAAYFLFGIIYSILAFKMTADYAKEEGYVIDLKFIFKYTVATTLQWPVLIRFFIWPGECWIEWTDEKGKKHWTRDKEEDNDI